MSNINNGGPAFPQASYNMAGGYDTKGGMSLRDYFAAKAMQGLLSGGYRDAYPSKYAKEIAEEAYCLADKMLAERGN